MSAKEDVPAASWSPLDVEERPVVWRGDVATVRESTWAGSYYCAHLYFVSQSTALAPGSSVVKNEHGEPLVGFLHVPADVQAIDKAAGPVVDKRPPHERHQATRHVVGRAVAGLVEDLKARVAKGPLRVLLTGFGAFPGIVDNPTGELVRHTDLVVSAVIEGLPGARRSAPTPTPLLGGTITVVRDLLRLADGRELIVAACELPVQDTTLDPDGPSSIHWVYERFRPHAHLAMGVHRGQDYRVELCADSAGLVVEGGKPRHHDGAPAAMKLPPNQALARAIARTTSRGNDGPP